MVKRDELANDLQDYLIFEEEIVNKLSNFCQALGWRSVVKEGCHKMIEESLNTLKSDTERHASMIKNMVKYTGEAKKDEF